MNEDAAEASEQDPGPGLDNLDQAPGASDGLAADSEPPETFADLNEGDASEKAEPVSVEELVGVLNATSKERDDYLDGMRRLQAEFENYRKAVAKRESEARERANESLVSELLPILDACDGAVENDIEGVAPIRSALVEALTRQGLERIDPVDAPFDPEQHEAVMHEPGEGDGGPRVSAVLRVGYAWKGRTLRAAMVQVSG